MMQCSPGSVVVVARPMSNASYGSGGVANDGHAFIMVQIPNDKGDPVKTVPMEDATLDRCIAEAQQERVILTRNGDPIALVVGGQGMDEEQIRLSSSLEFWNLIEENRRRKTISRQELERRLDQTP